MSLVYYNRTCQGQVYIHTCKPIKVGYTRKLARVYRKISWLTRQIGKGILRTTIVQTTIFKQVLHSDTKSDRLAGHDIWRV